MAFRIETFGPFRLHESAGIIDQATFRSDIEDARRGLLRSFGVYVIAAELKGKEFEPWYVGLTQSSFGTRFKSHLTKLKVISEIRKRQSEPSPLCVFLVAITTPKKTKVASPTVSRIRWVGTIETMLIGACIAANPRIVNNKKTLLGRKLTIPGFTGDRSTPDNPSAAAFARMLSNSNTTR